MRKLFLLISLFVFVTQAQGQWITLQNTGLMTNFGESVRYDDIYFISADTGFVVSSNGYLYKTYDGGNNWHVKANPNPPIYFRSIEFSDNGQFGIAGTLSGVVLRTVDRGETWTDISNAVSDTGLYARRMCGLAHWGNNIYGVGWWGATVARFYTSLDGGQTWQTSYIDTNLATSLVDVTFISADTCFATGFRLSADSGSSNIILRSIDAGQTWAKVFSDYTLGGGVWKIQFVNNSIGVGSIEPWYNPDTVVMVKTTDGGNTWHLIPVGHKNPDFAGAQGIGFLTPSKGWVGGYFSGMFETNDGGVTWDTISEGNLCNRYFRFGTSTMYASGDPIFKYTDSTAAVPHVTSPIPLGVHLLPINPNPAKGKIKIEFDLQSQNNIVLKIVGMDSRRVYNVASDYLKAGHYTYYWDGANVSSGNYMVWLGTDETPVVQKFVILK